MKKAGGSSKAADRMRRFSTATGAKVEETADGGVKVANASRPPSLRSLPLPLPLPIFLSTFQRPANRVTGQLCRCHCRCLCRCLFVSRLSRLDSLVCTGHAAHTGCGGPERSRVLWTACVQAHNPFLEQLQEEEEEEEELYLLHSISFVR